MEQHVYLLSFVNASGRISLGLTYFNSSIKKTKSIVLYLVDNWWHSKGKKKDAHLVNRRH